MFFFIVVFLLFLGAFTEDESIVLLRFKGQINDSTFTLVQSWNMDTNHCNWEGVECQGTYVTSLRLHSLGGIPGELFASTIKELSRLRTLHVSQSTFNFNESIHNFSQCTETLEVVELPGNQLQDTFAIESLLESCHNLKVLNVSHNKLQGGFPRGFLVNSLEKLDVSNNRFNGSIHSSHFHACTRLKFLNMSSNQLTGTVPEELLINCTSLEEVYLADNRFSGAFPALDTPNKLHKVKLSSNLFARVEIVGCRNLVELDISSNYISSPVFSSQTICPRLKVLDISRNSFSGEFFQSMVADSLNYSPPSNVLPSVEVIRASYNNFTGEVPVVTNGKLWYLDLSSNMLTSINGSMCEVSNPLESLIVPNNRLTGDILQTVHRCSRLKMLDVTFNAITGRIPETLCMDLPSLEYFLAWGNNLQGSIPPSLAKCRKLIMILLAYNYLKGPIPWELSELKDLLWLDLTGNMLTGNIPKSLGKLKKLEVLMLNKNMLDGEIPSELGDCKLLVVMEVGSNSLSGRLPPRLGRREAILERVNMARKDLNDSLGYLKIMQPIAPKCTGVVDAIPVQGIDVGVLERVVPARGGCTDLRMAQMPGYASNVSSLRALDVSHNKLTGEIPAEIGEMRSFAMFYGSHNEFNGSIPESIGNMRELSILDLSLNRLEGHIPETVGRLHFLRKFNVSHNNLSGTIPQSGQLTTMPASSFEGNPGLCGLPLTNVCGAKGYQSGNSTSMGTKGVHGDGSDAVYMLVVVTSGIIGFVVASIFSFHWRGIDRIFYRM